MLHTGKLCLVCVCVGGGGGGVQTYTIHVEDHLNSQLGTLPHIYKTPIKHYKLLC